MTKQNKPIIKINDDDLNINLNSSFVEPKVIVSACSGKLYNNSNIKHINSRKQVLKLKLKQMNHFYNKSNKLLSKNNNTYKFYFKKMKSVLKDVGFILNNLNKDYTYLSIENNPRKENLNQVFESMSKNYNQLLEKLNNKNEFKKSNNFHVDLKRMHNVSTNLVAKKNEVSVSVENNVNVKKIGNYSVTYTAKDNLNQISSKKVNVSVKKTNNIVKTVTINRKKYKIGSNQVITNANLSNFNFKKHNIKGMKFDNVNLSGADLSQNDLTNVKAVNIISDNETKLPENYFILNKILFGPGMDLSELILDNLDLSNRKLSGTNFYKSKLTNVILKNTNLFFSNIDLASLSNVDLACSDLGSVSFFNCNLTEVNFSNCDLRNTNFTLSKIEKSKFPNVMVDSYTKVPEYYFIINERIHKLPKGIEYDINKKEFITNTIGVIISEEFIVPEDFKLTINSNHILINTSSLVIYGTLDNKGTLNNNGEVCYSGKIDNTNGKINNTNNGKFFKSISTNPTFTNKPSGLNIYNGLFGMISDSFYTINYNIIVPENTELIINENVTLYINKQPTNEQSIINNKGIISNNGFVRFLGNTKLNNIGIFNNNENSSVDFLLHGYTKFGVNIVSAIFGDISGNYKSILENKGIINNKSFNNSNLKFDTSKSFFIMGEVYNYGIINNEGRINQYGDTSNFYNYSDFINKKNSEFIQDSISQFYNYKNIINQGNIFIRYEGKMFCYQDSEIRNNGKIILGSVADKSYLLELKIGSKLINGTSSIEGTIDLQNSSSKFVIYYNGGVRMINGPKKKITDNGKIYSSKTLDQ